MDDEINTRHRPSKMSHSKVGAVTPFESKRSSQTKVTKAKASNSFYVLLGMMAKHKIPLVVALGLSLLTSIAGLAQPAIINQLIGKIGSEPIGFLVLVLAVLLIIHAIADAFQIYLLTRTAEHAILNTRKDLLGRLLRMPISIYDAQRTGDLVTRLGSDTTLVRTAFTGGVVDMVGGVFTMVGAIVLMAMIDLPLLVTVLAVLVSSTLVVVIASSKIQEFTKELQKAVGSLGAGMDRALGAIRTIRSANASAQVESELQVTAYEAFTKGRKIAVIEGLLYPVSGLALQVSFLIVLGFGGARVATGVLGVGDLVAFVLYLFMLSLPLGLIFSAVNTIRSAMGAIDRIQEVMQIAPEDDLGFTARPAQSVCFSDVYFSYPHYSNLPISSSDATSDQPISDSEPQDPSSGGVPMSVLSGVSLEIRAGQTTALVGPSGAGKSTILALMQRFYDPSAGQIFLGEQDMSQLSRSSVREQIGYVEQEAAILAGTVWQNLQLASPQVSEEQAWSALERVGLKERFERARGLDTVIGDRGMSLSGGQRQRLALARMLLMDCSMLLLDEPTSAVDSRNEELILSAIKSASRDRTLVVVAHRLSTVVDADQIIVVNEGRVSASGTHAELLKASPLYKELAEKQLMD
ncbi:ABC transporter ATP-binding protein [Corynebacterium dentalis]|uniref:ABC transporter ATP-binding protein n=1 Tax=Corynebacterium dentalis TaxID=2014528 RepID=UPI00289D4EA8|nr:ABC transporter ATP-binding protein [Corynebacterium dentalis]